MVALPQVLLPEDHPVHWLPWPLHIAANQNTVIVRHIDRLSKGLCSIYGIAALSTQHQHRPKYTSVVLLVEWPGLLQAFSIMHVLVASIWTPALRFRCTYRHNLLWSCVQPDRLLTVAVGTINISSMILLQKQVLACHTDMCLMHV